jgi:hypothetical protein
MTVAELIECLKDQPQDIEIWIYDGHNQEVMPLHLDYINHTKIESCPEFKEFEDIVVSQEDECYYNHIFHKEMAKEKVKEIISIFV